MRRTIITAAAAVALTTVSPARAAGNAALRDQRCAAMAELAENMAWVHQNGMSLSQALETSNSLAGTNDQLRKRPLDRRPTLHSSHARGFSPAASSGGRIVRR